MSARNETPHKVVQALGKKKCNGSWEDSTENLTMEQIKDIATEQEFRKDEKGNIMMKKDPNQPGVPEPRLSGKNLYARCREIMGTCVSMRVRIEGMEPKEALKAMSEGEFSEHFS